MAEYGGGEPQQTADKSAAYKADLQNLIDAVEPARHHILTRE